MRIALLIAGEVFNDPVLFIADVLLAWSPRQVTDPETDVLRNKHMTSILAGCPESNPADLTLNNIIFHAAK